MVVKTDSCGMVTFSRIYRLVRRVSTEASTRDTRLYPSEAINKEITFSKVISRKYVCVSINTRKCRIGRSYEMRCLPTQVRM